MKKKLFSIIIVAAVAAAAAWNYNQSSNEVTLSDVALSNVEALAGGENGRGPDYNGYERVYKSSGDCCERARPEMVCSGIYSPC